MKTAIFALLTVVALLFASCEQMETRVRATVIINYDNGAKDTITLVTRAPESFVLGKTECNQYDLWDGNNRLAKDIRSFSIINIEPYQKGKTK
jgi:hypothetical protein